MNDKVNRDRIFRPGEICPQSGQYAIVDAEGMMTGPERTLVRDEPFPPTPQRDQGYLLVDPTQHDAVATTLDSREEKGMARPDERQTEGKGLEKAVAQRLLDAAVTTALVKSGVSMLLSVIVFGFALWFLWLLVGLIGELGEQTREVWGPLIQSSRELFGLLEELRYQGTPEDVVAVLGMYSNVLQLQGPAVLLFAALIRLLTLAVTAGLLFLLGVRLLNREVIEKELDGTGSVAQRLRSGLGQMKPIEEMIHSVFGRSRSAWAMRLWAARITLVIGVIVLFVAIFQLLFPGLFPGVDKALFFGAGVGVSLLSTVTSRWLNPAEALQEALGANALIELTVISFAKQIALVEGWMGRALLSLKPDDDWGPESEVLRSLVSNSQVIQAALDHAETKISKLRQGGSPATKPDG